MRRERLLIFVSISFVLFAICGGVVFWLHYRSTTRRTSPIASGIHLRWDFSKGRSGSIIGQPATHGIWFIDGPGELEVRFPEGRRGDYPFWNIQARPDGTLVRMFVLSFEPEDLESAHARAKALAQQWDLKDLDDLDRWLAARRLDKARGNQDPREPNFSASSAPGSYPQFTVGIKTTFSDDKAWVVEWGAAFDSPGRGTRSPMTLPGDRAGD